MLAPPGDLNTFLATMFSGREKARKDINDIEVRLYRAEDFQNTVRSAEAVLSWTGKLLSVVSSDNPEAVRLEHELLDEPAIRKRFDKRMRKGAEGE